MKFSSRKFDLKQVQLTKLNCIFIKYTNLSLYYVAWRVLRFWIKETAPSYMNKQSQTADNGWSSSLTFMFFTRLTSWQSASKIIAWRRKIPPLYPLPPI